MEVKIEDKNEDGVGEICVKGPNVMLGYYNMPEETAKVIKDGWFHTGDLGYVDDEEFIYITGRKKNVIITANGKNVFPEELEYYLGRSTMVSESMVWAQEDESGQDTVIVATIKPDMEEVEAAIGKDAAGDDAQVEKLLWTEVDKINENLPFFKKIKKGNSTSPRDMARMMVTDAWPPELPPVSMSMGMNRVRAALAARASSKKPRMVPVKVAEIISTASPGCCC